MNNNFTESIIEAMEIGNITEEDVSTIRYVCNKVLNNLHTTNINEFFYAACNYLEDDGLDASEAKIREIYEQQIIPNSNVSTSSQFKVKH